MVVDYLNYAQLKKTLNPLPLPSRDGPHQAAKEILALNLYKAIHHIILHYGLCSQ